MLRVDHHVWVGLQEVPRENAVFVASIGEICVPLLDRVEVAPFLELVVVLQDVVVESIGHPVERHAVAGVYYKLLLEPQLLLEVL
jgi:hypothetical protein